MLGLCLESLIEQTIPDDWLFEILVVNNSPDSDISKTIEAITSLTSIRIHVTTEPQAGIPYARNAACRKSLELGADWLLMMDDDEVAEPNWLMAYASALKRFKAEVLTGPVNYIFPAGYGWLENKGKSLLNSGNLVRRASTNNVLFSKTLLLPPLNLAFDTHMRFTGGEDSDFFMRYVCEFGGKIVVVADAVVSEVVQPNRLRISWRLGRQYWSSSSRVYTRIKLFGFRSTLSLCLKEIPMRIFHGALRLVVSPAFFLGGTTAFLKSYYHGLRHFAKAAGTLAGLMGKHAQPYKIQDGH